MTSPLGTLLFVYGTLKRGCSNHRSLRGQAYLGEGNTVGGFRLFDLGDYPGMVRSEDDPHAVCGEVWRVDDACLAHLDVLEGVAAGLYRRDRVHLQPPFDQEIIVTYLYALSVLDRTDLGSVWREK